MNTNNRQRPYTDNLLRIPRGERPTSLTSRREPLNNPAMQEALSVLARQSLQHAAPADRAPSSHTNLGPIPSDDKDGISHVNFGPSSKSQLGQLLSFANTLRFWHPILEVEVPSMQHFWVFLQEGATNKQVFKFGNDKLRAFMRTAGPGNYVPNQYAMLAQAYWFKFQEHSLLGETFANMNVLFDYYLSDARGRRRPVSAGHLVDILKNLKTAIRNNREPDLTQFMDRDVQLEVRGLQFEERVYRNNEILIAGLKRSTKSVAETPAAFSDHAVASAPQAPQAPAPVEAPQAPAEPAAPSAPEAPAAPVAETEIEFAGFVPVPNASFVS